MTKPDDVATAVQTPSEAEAALRAADRRGEVRFTPGTILGNRYRIISLLGRGGMGEVYRAEDVKLGQPVALKFVPRDVPSDPGILERLYSEVRIGRDVAHPNVCRLYDIVEFEGDHFIAMQYVDGEDLASLLRRIGRLPAEKAIDIARDLCAGLAAAHDRGVIHRDLKPANVMIDGRGRAHVTDFGLAVLTNDAQKRGIAGTPVYMAPEQLAGERVTTASDVYSLGLILYEIFTGRRMFEAGSVTEIAQQHQQTKPRLGSIVRDVPPAIEAIVMQCLAEEPGERPRSARAVLAALPGGDPLAAAVAAGETPSPEMVAASAKTGELPAPIAGIAVVAFIAILAGVAALAPRTTLFSQERLRKTPEALSDRAEDVVHMSGVTGDPFDHDAFFIDRQRERRGVQDRDSLAFVYRRSPAPLTAQNAENVVRLFDPPLLYPASATVQLAGDGRLLSLVSVPENADRRGSIDDLFRAAGYDRSQFRAVPPRTPPPVGADQRFAWDGPVPIEAASYRGGIVWFDVNPQPLIPPKTTLAGLGGVMWTVMFLGCLAGSLILIIRNLRRGRTDLRGAFRAAIVAFVFSVLSFFLNAHLTRIQVGQHITQVISLQLRIFVILAGNGVPTVSPGFLSSLGSTARAVSWVLHVPAEALGYSLGAVFFLLLGRVFIKWNFIYIPRFIAMLALAETTRSGSSRIDLLAGLIDAIILVVAIYKGGMLMVFAAWSCAHLIAGLPITLELGAWYATLPLFIAACLIGVVAYAFYLTIPRGRTLASVPATT